MVFAVRWSRKGCCTRQHLPVGALSGAGILSSSVEPDHRHEVEHDGFR
jgi:hypothetical protein